MTIEERDAYLKALIDEKFTSRRANRAWTDEDRILRDEAIYHEMGLGKSNSQIAYDLSERWGCHFGTIMRYIKEAKQRLIATNNENPEMFKNKMMEKLERLAKNAEEHGDRKSMLAAYDQINKINGNYTQKIEADVNATIKFEFGE